MEVDRYKRAVDAAQEIIWGHRDLRFVFANVFAAKYVGQPSPEAMIGLPMLDFIHPDDHPLVLQRTRRFVEDGAALPPVELRVRRAEGGYGTIEFRAVRIVDEGGPAVIGVGRDIGERKSLERQLQRSARIEAIGKLTGGIAHDFNNLLTIVIGNLELAAEAARGNERATSAVRHAMGAAERGADLVARLLAFARQQPLAPTAFDLNERVLAMRAILERSLGEAIQLEFRLAPDLWAVHADAAQVEMAVLNLALNAHDALPDGGRVVVETANERLDAAYAALNEDVAAGEYAMLAVSDNGVGMTAEVLQRAVEPFFTTKEVGKGSGLGLSMIYGFAKQSGGHLKIYSEPGVGTTVRVYLPRAGALAAAAPSPASRAEPGLPTGRERILVVEDNDEVRRIVVRQLVDLGYAVSEAANGPAALELLRAAADFDLLFSDVVMPKGMSGRVLADQAVRERPGLKVLLTTGYTAGAILQGGPADEGVALLSKPYSRATLARKVREVIDG